MAVLTSWTFWLVLGAIVIIMAAIGYLAEGTELANKEIKETKSKEKLEENVQTNKENVISENTENNIVQADYPIEILDLDSESTVWNDEPKEDTKEVVQNVVVDQWNTMPDSNDAIFPEIQKSDFEKINNISENNSINENSSPSEI